MSLEIAWKQNILVTDFHLLKLQLVVFGFGSQTFICGFSRQNICSVFPRIVSARETILFGIWKLQKISIFYLINRIFAAETIQGRKLFKYIFFTIIVTNKLVHKVFFVHLHSRMKLLPYLKRLCYAFPIFWIGQHLQRKSTGIAVSKAFARLIASLCRPQNRLFTNMTRD